MATRRAQRRHGPGRLDRSGIVTVALGTARAEGIHAVTMRRIAEELGCSPMALYRHVADRQELLLAMLDDIAARVELPPPAAGPRAEIRALMTTAHRVLAEDPWVVTVLVVDGLASPKILPLIERLVAALRAAGLDGPGAIAAYALLWQFTYGELLARHHDRADAWNKRMVRESDPAAYPQLHDALASLGGPGRLPDRYAEDLAVLLDGLLGRE